MPTDRRVGASGVAQRIGGIEDFLWCQRHHWDNHGELISGHHPGLLLCTRAPVYRAPNVSRVPFRIPRCRVNGHPALSMPKGAEDDTPGMGTRTRLSDRPALLFRILQGFTNVPIRMVGHWRL